MTITVDDMEFDDGQSAGHAHENLWRAVLMHSIEEAFYGPRSVSNRDKATRLRLIKEARDYIAIPNADFREVCYLAGLDPEAVRERVMKRLADAPTAKEIAHSINRRGKLARAIDHVEHRRERKAKAIREPVYKPDNDPRVRAFIERGNDSAKVKFNPAFACQPNAANKARRNHAANAKLHTAFGKTRTLKEWATETGLSPNTIRNRINLGWMIEQALTLAPQQGIKPGGGFQFATLKGDRRGEHRIRESEYKFFRKSECH